MFLLVVVCCSDSPCVEEVGAALADAFFHKEGAPGAIIPFVGRAFILHESLDLHG